MKAILVCIIAGLPCGCVDAPGGAVRRAREPSTSQAGNRPGSTATVLTSPGQLGTHVGQTVTLRGVVTNTKIPTILGVDVQSDDPDLRGQLAEATGVLQRWVVTPESLAELQRNGPVANRGTGTFYRLKAPASDYTAAVRPASP